MPLSAAAKALPSLRVPIPVKRVLTHPDAPYSDSNAEERKAEGECGTADCPVDAQENVVSPSSNLRAANARRGSVNVTPTHRLSRRNTTMRPPTASRPSTFPRKSSTRTGLRKARTQAHVHKPLSALPFLHTRRKSTRHGPVRLARPACPENSLPCEVYVQRYENPFRLRRRRAAKAARRKFYSFVPNITLCSCACHPRRQRNAQSAFHPQDVYEDTTEDRRSSPRDALRHPPTIRPPPQGPQASRAASVVILRCQRVRELERDVRATGRHARRIRDMRIHAFALPLRGQVQGQANCGERHARREDAQAHGVEHDTRNHRRCGGRGRNAARACKTDAAPIPRLLDGQRGERTS